MIEPNEYSYRPLADEQSPVPDQTPDLASRGRRLGAVLIDTGLWLVPGGFFVVATMGELWESDAIPWHFAVPAVVIMVALAVVQLIFLARRAQSIGKKILGLVIHDERTGRKAGFVQIVFLRTMVTGLMSSIPILGSIFGLVDVLVIFGDERKCLHDRIANTRVVRLARTGD